MVKRRDEPDEPKDPALQDEPKAPALQAVATGTASATGVLLLTALALRAGVFARGIGVVIGNAVVAVIRSAFSALGGLLAPWHP